MAHRLIEFRISEDQSDDIGKVIEELPTAFHWTVPLGEDRVLWKVLMHEREVEAAIAALDPYFENNDEYNARLVVLPVEAVVPRPPEPEEAAKEAPKAASPEEAAEPKSARALWIPLRISREELYEDIAGSAQLSRIFLIQVGLATIVACIGMARDMTAVLIGAMVIAPLLGPNIALGLATTLADLKLGRRALMASLVGSVLAIAIALLTGLGLSFDDELPRELALRTNVGAADLILALASGCAGALAFTTGLATYLVGVMVAVALLPPTAATGMLLGAGRYADALSAAHLLAINIVCVNLAAVVTFFFQGIRPRLWWEADRAKTAFRTAIIFWVGMLLVLAALIFVKRFLA